MKAFFLALVTDKSGQIDEAAFSYIAVQLFVFCGVMYDTIVTKHFDFKAFIIGQGALLALYNVTVKK